MESKIYKLANIEKEKQKDLDQDTSWMKGKFWSQIKKSRSENRIIFVSFSNMDKYFLLVWRTRNPRGRIKPGIEEN